MSSSPTGHRLRQTDDLDEFPKLNRPRTVQDFASNNDLGPKRVRNLHDHSLEYIILTPVAAVAPVTRLIALMTLSLSKTKKVMTPNGVVPTKYRHPVQTNKCRSSASRMILTAALSSGSSFNHGKVGDGVGFDELGNERCGTQNLGTFHITIFGSPRACPVTFCCIFLRSGSVTTF